jgi:hypothetical protein
VDGKAKKDARWEGCIERNKVLQKEEMGEIRKFTDEEMELAQRVACRCGCKRQPDWIVLCPDYGNPIPTMEACCGSAKDYLTEACAEIGALCRVERIVRSRQPERHFKADDGQRWG